jgi:hypothetical protein
MEEQVGNVILGESGPSDKFTLKWGIFKFRLGIKPLTAEMMIRISREISKISEVKAEAEMFTAFMKGCPDLVYISRIIAIATGTRFNRIVAKAVLGLDLKDIRTLFSIVRKQCDSEVFFYIIVTAGKMNLLKKQERQGEENLSGVV